MHISKILGAGLLIVGLFVLGLFIGVQIRKARTATVITTPATLPSPVGEDAP
jgi:hypothetical protein